MAYLGHKPAVGENNSFRILDDISSFVLTFDGSSASAVGLSDETITITENNHRFITGQRVTYSNGGGGNITGLVNGQAYFVINHSKTQIKLASSASNALAGTAVNLTGLGTGSSHTLTLAFDGVNTKFDPTFGDGMHDTLIKRAAQLVISINGVIQQPHDTATPSTGFGVDSLGHIIFSTAPASTDIFWGHILASNTVTFDSSDNDVDTFTGNGSTTSFTLSKIPPDNRNILVTIDGVVQYPSDAANTRSYNVSENVMTFVAAPGLGTVIQVRHIGYAGIGAGGGGGVTGFYGRTGNVSLISTDNITVNDAAITGNASITGNLTVDGDMTTLNTTLREVELLRVDATNDTLAAGIITQRGSGDILNLYDNNTEVFSVADGGALTINSATDQMLNLNSSDNNGTSLAFQRNGSRQGYIGYGGASSGLIIANEVDNGAVAIQGKDGGSYINMLSFDTANEGVATLHGGALISAGKRVGFATDSNTYIEQDGLDRLSFTIGGLKTVSMIEAGTNYPVLLVDKNGTNTYGTQGAGYNSNGNSNDLVIGNVSSGNHGMTICTPSTGLGNINFSDGSGGGADAYRGSVGYNHSTEQMIVRAKSGTVILKNDATNTLVASGGSVGIGTDVPQNNLEVVGGITVTGEAPNQGLYFSDPSNKIEYFSIYKHASDNSLRVHGYDSSWGDKITILRNGNVGINSTIPSQKVDVIGTVKATNFVGALPISNDGNDRVLTSSGSGVVNAEANLTMTGNILQFNTTANTHGMRFVATGNHYNTLSFDSNITSGAGTLTTIDFKWDGDKVADILAVAGSDTTNKDDGHLVFRTSASQGSIAEALRITSAGLIKIDEASPVAGTNGASALLQVKSLSQYDGLLLGHGYEYGTISRGASNGALIYTANASPGNLGGGEKIMHEWWSGSAGGGGPNRLMVLSASGRLGINEASPDRELHISSATNGGVLRFTNTDTTIADDTICGMIEFEQRDSNTPGVSANVRAELTDTTNGACSLNFSTGTPSTIGTRVILDSSGNLQIRGTNHATRYYRDDGARYGSILYDGYNFVSRMPAGDNFQVELFDGTVHTRFNNVNGSSGSGSMLDFYGGDNTYMYVRGGTETKPSIYMGGGASGLDNSRIGTKYNLALACNEDGNQTGRKIVFYDDDVKLAELREDNQGSSSAQGCLYTTGPGAIRDYYDMRNVNLEGTTFDYVSNDSDGGGTSWEIKNGRVIRLYSTSGGHGGNWMRPVYIRESGYYYWRCNFRLTTTCGSIHPVTSTNNYKYAIRFRFNLHGSGAGNNCYVEHNKQYATSGNCNGNQTGTGSLADGTYVTRTGDAVYITAGTYQPKYFTSGYDGVRELHIYELALIQCGSGNSGANIP